MLGTKIKLRADLFTAVYKHTLPALRPHGHDPKEQHRELADRQPPEEKNSAQTATGRAVGINREDLEDSPTRAGGGGGGAKDPVHDHNITAKQAKYLLRIYLVIATVLVLTVRTGPAA